MHCLSASHGELRLSTLARGRRAADSPGARKPGMHRALHGRSRRRSSCCRPSSRAIAAANPRETSSSTECRRRSKMRPVSRDAIEAAWRGSATSCARGRAGNRFRSVGEWSMEELRHLDGGLMCVRVGLPKLSRHRSLPYRNRSIAPSPPPWSASERICCGARRRSAVSSSRGWGAGERVFGRRETPAGCSCLCCRAMTTDGRQPMNRGRRIAGPCRTAASED